MDCHSAGCSRTALQLPPLLLAKRPAVAACCHYCNQAACFVIYLPTPHGLLMPAGASRETTGLAPSLPRGRHAQTCPASC